MCEAPAANYIHQIIAQFFTEKRPLDTIAVGGVARVLETVGLTMILTYWGTRTSKSSQCIPIFAHTY